MSATRPPDVEERINQAKFLQRFCVGRPRAVSMRSLHADVTAHSVELCERMAPALPKGMVGLGNSPELDFTVTVKTSSTQWIPLWT